jgi:hypothetical protein
MTWRGRTLGWATVALVAVASVLLASCAGSGYNYVKSSNFHTYYKVPSNWKLFSEKDVVAANFSDLSKQQLQQVLDTSWHSAFDANPKPSLRHVFSLAKSPNGYAVVSTLSTKDSDTVSDSTLRNFFLDVDSAVNDDKLTLSQYETVDPSGGFHGIHLVGRLVTGDATAENDYQGPAVEFDQVVYVDQAHQHIYAMIVSCSATCYETNTGKIESVINSWTVKDS